MSDNEALGAEGEDDLPFDQAGKSMHLKPIYIYIGAGLLALFGVVWGIAGISGKKEEPGKMSLAEPHQSHSTSAAPAMTGDESDAYLAEVEAYNLSIYDGDRQGHPIPTRHERTEVNQEIKLDDYGLRYIRGVDGRDYLEENPEPSTSTAGGSTPSRGGQGSRDELFNDLVGVMNRIAYQPSLKMVSVSRDETQGSEEMAGSAGQGSIVPVSGPEGLNGERAPEVKVEAATLAYAVSNIALNSDYEGPVWLTIIGQTDEAPELEGAELIGKAVNLGDKMRLELDTMRLKGGGTYSIDAIALDPDTTYAALASSVDNHTLYRYGWWGFGTVLRAAGRAARDSSQQIVVQDGVVIGSSTATGRKELLIGAGELGQELSQEFRGRLNRPRTVHVDQNTEMGVFFLKEVRW